MIDSVSGPMPSSRNRFWACASGRSASSGRIHARSEPANRKIVLRISQERQTEAAAACLAAFAAVSPVVRARTPSVAAGTSWAWIVRAAFAAAATDFGPMPGSRRCEPIRSSRSSRSESSGSPATGGHYAAAGWRSPRPRAEPVRGRRTPAGRSPGSG